MCHFVQKFTFSELSQASDSLPLATTSANVRTALSRETMTPWSNRIAPSRLLPISGIAVREDRETVARVGRNKNCWKKNGDRKENIFQRIPYCLGICTLLSAQAQSPHPFPSNLPSPFLLHHRRYMIHFTLYNVPSNSTSYNVILVKVTSLVILLTV